MPRNIDIGLMRTFIVVTEAGGMTAAARILHLTQAAVSQQVKRLEDLFGMELFVRERRQLQLTGPGQRLFANAKRLVAMNDEIYGLMTAPDHEGEVRVGVPHDIVAPFMPPILQSFHKRWPRVRVALTSRNSFDLLDMVANGLLDMTLTTEIDPDLGEGLLLADRLAWIGAPGGISYQETPLPIVMGGLTCAFRQPVASALESIGRDWTMVCESHDMGAMLAMIQADLGIMAHLSAVVPPELEVIDAPEHLPPLPSFYINLKRSNASRNPITDAFFKHIKSYFVERRQALDDPMPATRAA